MFPTIINNVIYNSREEVIGFIVLKDKIFLKSNYFRRYGRYLSVVFGLTYFILT